MSNEEILNKVVKLYGKPNCKNLHHKTRHQHPYLESCPVEEEIAKLLLSLK